MHSNYNPLEHAWEGFKLVDLKHHSGAGIRWLELYLEPEATIQPRCSICGTETSHYHDSRIRMIRDLPILDEQVRLWVRLRRIRCPRCGIASELVSWVEPYQHMTKRLCASVEALCMATTIKAAAHHYCLGWDQVKKLDKEHLKATLTPVDLSHIEFLLMDEFALQRGHRYATVVFEPKRRRVLWIGRGRGRQDIRPFFDLLGPERCTRIKAIGMDMTAAYAEEVKLHCPQAMIGYDLFHVLARYGHEVIDRVRVDEANRVRSDKSHRALVKGSRWMLLRNRDHLDPSQRIRLDELLAANKHLLTAYVLKDDLKRLWSFSDPLKARLFWMEWRARAFESKLAPLVRFAENLEMKIDYVLSHCLFPLGTSILEGVNNRIKVIKRMAYGFRDDQYFFLKIRDAFP